MDLLGTELVDSLIRRYRVRPGCRFLDILPVGIPIHVVRLLTVYSESQKIPPIEEFVLKSLVAGVDTVEDICGFLGLHQKTVESVLVSLHLNELIAVPPIAAAASSLVDRGNLLLTEKGRAVLESLSRKTIIEKKLDGVTIHGFSGQPVSLDERSLLSQSDLKQFGLLELPAIPRECPRADLIDVPLLQQCLLQKAPHARKSQGGTVVGVRAVLKPKRLRYRPAFMLQYESTGQQRQASYIFVGLNGEQDTASESAFNAKKGPARIAHLVPMLSDSFVKPQAIVAEFLTEKQFSTIPLSGLTQQAELKAQIEALENSMIRETPTVTASPQTLVDRIAARREVQAAPVPTTSRTAELREKNSLLEAELQQLRDKLAECPYQMLATHECAKTLRDAMATASRRLMIVSAFLSSQVVNDSFIQRLEDCLKRGVEVWVGFGFGDKAKRSRLDWSHAEDALKDLRRKYKKSMVLHDFKNSHEKLLIKDDDYVVVGSYNWLSFEQERGASYRRENALLVKNARVISDHWDEFSRVMKPESKAEN